MKTNSQILQNSVAICLGSLFLASPSLAKPEWINLNKLADAYQQKNIYALNAKQIQSQDALAKLKYYESHRKWDLCLKSYDKIKWPAKEVHPWILNSLLHCLDEADVFQGKTYKSVLQKLAVALESGELDKVPSLPLSDLKSRYIRLLLNEKIKKETPKSASDKLKHFEVLYSFFKNNDLSDKVALLDKLKALAKVAKSENWQSVLSDERRSAALLPKIESEETAAELALTEKMDAAVQKKDAKKLFELLVKYFNDFPAGVESKKWLGRYAGMIDDMKFTAKEIEAAKSLDAGKRADLASALFRRQEYSLVTKLLSTSADTSIASFAALGRSFHYLGQYEEAVDVYQEAFAKFPAAEEIIDLRLKCGLALVRQKKYAEALKQFDWLSKRNKSEIAGLYWKYWMQKQLKQNDSAASTADALVNRYPFSYYGLRVELDRNSSLEKLVKNAAKYESKKALWILASEEESLALKRAKILSTMGWHLEVQREMQLLKFDSSPERKMIWSQFLAKLQQYPSAIKLVADAMEAEPNLRNFGNIKAVYPKPYQNLVEDEAAKYKFNPALVYSLIRQESAFGLRSVSTSSAMGLMQMIPLTAQEIATALKMDVKIPEEMFLPEINIPMGVWYMNQTLKGMKGSVPAMLAGYNAGPSKIEKFLKSRKELEVVFQNPSSDPMQELWFDELPWSETMFYVKAILRNFILYSAVDTPKVQFNDPVWSSSIVK